MNKSNAGANTNTLQILLDVLIVVCAFAIDFWTYGTLLDERLQVNLIALIAVFLLIYILSNKEEYLYNVTMFYYLDRVYRKLTKSFLIATVATAALMNFMDFGETERKCYNCHIHRVECRAAGAACTGGGHASHFLSAH